MTAAPVDATLLEVRPHRTREGRLDYVTVQHEPDGVVRVLGWYDSRSAAQRAVDHLVTAPAPLVLRAVGMVLRPVSLLVR